MYEIIFKRKKNARNPALRSGRYQNKFCADTKQSAILISVYESVGWNPDCFI
ncbi:MAG: hypothetical protein LBD53_10295 [Tannerella sp.]|jgi:hypothetical protein|nr:hypothetical protein [Tannerella sp.]